MGALFSRQKAKPTPIKGQGPSPKAPRNPEPSAKENPGLDFTTSVTKTGDAITSGRLWDVYRGSIQDDSNKAAVKVLRRVRVHGDGRSPGAFNQQLLDQIKSNAVKWNQLQNENIVSFLGYASIDGQPSVIYTWCSEKNLTDFLLSVGRNNTNTRALVKQIAIALEYLHTLPQPVAHGDLKPRNIFVSPNLRVKLGDVGLSDVVERELSGAGHLDEFRDTARYRSPESLRGEVATPPGDIYAFASVALETVSGKFPYANVQAELAVMKTKLDGTTPVQSSYPELSRDPLWALLKKCWNSKPQSRPQIAQVLAQLNKLHY